MSTQREVIESIGQDFGAVPFKIAHGYGAMLEKLGVEIYSQSTRFVLEMIQNADDNSYSPGIKPSLTFTATKRFIEIRSNEVGFTSSDVRALCDVDQSTKKGSKDTIGEKGIGFKSVFKLADTVHIRSNGFHFLFDKNNGPFGMVLPIWRELRGGLGKSADSVILLRIPSRSNIKPIHESMEGIQPTMLLFLRKISQLSVSTPRFLKRFSCSTRDESIVTITSREWNDMDLIDEELGYGTSDKVDPTDDAVVLEEAADVQSQRYFLCRRTFTLYVEEPRRPNAGPTEISVAVPFGRNAIIKTQDVHAFLPIRDYGFKFVIQADFLLTSSREDIDGGCIWNHKLREGIVSTVVAAIHEMNQRPNLCFTWMRYLPGPNLPSSFLSILGGGINSPESILYRLKRHGAKILWSCAGTLQTPASLTYVPREFRSRNGEPLLSRIGLQRILSTEYAANDLPVLMALGVEEMNVESFVGHLKSLEVEKWKDLDLEWHQDLAKVLLKLPLRLIEDLDLVPLEGEDLEWVSARAIRNYPVFQKPNLGRVQVPPGLHMRFVEAAASENENRVQLFIRLGVRPSGTIAICEAIESQIRSRNPPKLSDMVNQIKFLFRNRAMYNTQNVLINQAPSTLSSSTHARKGEELYLDDPRMKTPISTIFKDCSNVPYLHPAYLVNDPDIEQDLWLDWLVRQLEISPIPRMSASGLSGPPPEFREWVLKASREAVIRVIVDHWGKYRDQILSNPVSKVLREKLKNTILPLPSLLFKAQTFGLDRQNALFLQMDIPTRQQKIFESFNHYGVITTDLSSDFHLLILRWLHKLPEKNFSDPKLVHNIYKSLQDCHNEKEIWDAFANEELVAMTFRNPFGERIEWKKTSTCVWNGPKCLRFNLPLSAQYPDCEKLFCNILHVQKSADITTIVTDARRASQTPFLMQTENFKPYLLELSILVKQSVEENEFGALSCLDDLKDLPMFPVKERDGLVPKLVKRCDLSSPSFNFVADRADLHEVFQNKVPLLDFSVDEVYALMPLLENFVHPRFLSKEAPGHYVSIGEKVLNWKLTSKLRGKSPELFRCLRHYSRTRLTNLQESDLHERLKNIAVIDVGRVDCQRSLGAPFSPFEVNITTQGEATLSYGFRLTGLYVYITSDEALRTKAFCHTLPGLFVSTFALTCDAQAMIATILQLQCRLIGPILDEAGIARLPESERALCPNLNSTIDVTSVLIDIGPSLTINDTEASYFNIYRDKEIGSSIICQYQSITCSSFYRNSSFEELRLAEYERVHSTQRTNVVPSGQTPFGPPHPQAHKSESSNLFASESLASGSVFPSRPRSNFQSTQPSASVFTSPPGDNSQSTQAPISVLTSRPKVNLPSTQAYVSTFGSHSRIDPHSTQPSASIFTSHPKSNPLSSQAPTSVFKSRPKVKLPSTQPSAFIFASPPKINPQSTQPPASIFTSPPKSNPPSTPPSPFRFTSPPKMNPHNNKSPTIINNTSPSQTKSTPPTLNAAQATPSETPQTQRPSGVAPSNNPSTTQHAKQPPNRDSSDEQSGDEVVAADLVGLNALLTDYELRLSPLRKKGKAR